MVCLHVYTVYTLQEHVCRGKMLHRYTATPLHRYTSTPFYVQGYLSTLGSPSPSVFLQDAHQASSNTIIRCDCRGILYDALLLLWQCIDRQIFELYIVSWLSY